MTSDTPAIIPAVAVLLLSHERERWLVVHRRGSLRLLLHAPCFDRDSFWDDAVRRARVLCARQEGVPGEVPALRVNLAPCFSGGGLHAFLSERFRSRPQEIVEAFNACLEAEEVSVIPL